MEGYEGDQIGELEEYDDVMVTASFQWDQFVFLSSSSGLNPNDRANLKYLNLRTAWMSSWPRVEEK